MFAIVPTLYPKLEIQTVPWASISIAEKANPVGILIQRITPIRPTIKGGGMRKNESKKRKENYACW